MIEWFFALDRTTQIVIATSIASSFITAIIAVLGFWLTFKTSTAANKEIANVTKGSKLDELKHLSRIKIADYRMEWIDALRNDSAKLYKIQYEISSLKRKKTSDRSDEERTRLLRLYHRSGEVKARILLRIKQYSNDPNELKLEKVLKRAVSEDGDEAQELRREIRELTRAILKTEWNRVQAELNNVN
jgi:hypothetical protein